MSKWLRRGSGQNTPSGDERRNQFPEPTTHMQGASTGNHHHHHHQSSQQHMIGGYGNSENFAMEVEHGQRSKYSHHSQYSGNGNKSMTAEANQEGEKIQMENTEIGTIVHLPEVEDIHSNRVETTIRRDRDQQVLPTL